MLKDPAVSLVASRSAICGREKSSLSRLLSAFPPLLLVLLFAAGGPLLAEQAPLEAGSLVLELQSPSLVSLDASLGCREPLGADDPYGDLRTGGGPVSSPLDINDMIIIPPQRVSFQHGNGVFSSGHLEAELRLVRLCTQSSQVFTSECGKSFAVAARALPGASASPGSLELFALSQQTGRFLVELPLQLELTLTNLDDPTEVIKTTQSLRLAGSGAFDRNPVQGGQVLTYPTGLDSDCDGVEESLLPPNSDLFLGARKGSSAPFCLDEFGASLCLAPAKVYGKEGTDEGRN